MDTSSSVSLSKEQFRELLRLRGEMGGLRRKAEALRKAKAIRDSDALLSASQVWPARVSRLKQWLEEHPSEIIPELARMPDKTWLNSIYPNALETDEDCRSAMSVIRDNAESPTRNALSDALRHWRTRFLSGREKSFACRDQPVRDRLHGNIR
jgi:hypothetical protein